MARGPARDGIPEGRLRRVAPVAGLAARTAGESVISSLRRHRDQEPEEYAHRAERYAEVLGRSKGALMKAGQLLAYVPFGSAVPAENRALYQTAMSRLLADAPPMAPRLASEVIEAELGAPPETLFAEFSRRPLAAASIGQVHSARLHDGRKVAVKVQYPGAGAAIAADLKNTELIAVFIQLLRSFVPGLTRSDPRAFAAEITARISEELDYRVEASNQMLFAAAYRGHPFFHVPEVVEDLSTRRVLTQELSEGMSWPEALLCDQALRDQWSESIFRFVFGSIQHLKAFNADPHPGNYHFHEDGSVTFLDFGCVKHLSDTQAAGITEIIRSVLRQDAGHLWNVYAGLGVSFDGRNRPTPEEFLAWYSGTVLFGVSRQPQPFTITPEFVARLIEHEFSPTGPSRDIVRSINTPGDFAFITRIDMGLMSVLAELRATADWLEIQNEQAFGAAPATPIGEADAAFWAPASPESVS
jgi:predicted unusual protein kinase regulating ubiquinone biosynthesis (AarF/ABC1/UbiB family)